MIRSKLNFDILEAKKAYANGENITELLRAQKNLGWNTPEIIETAYDLQAGSYIADIIRDPSHSKLYTAELAEILQEHIREGDSLLDIGTGELTTLSQLMCKLKQLPKAVYAFDISWSRISKGIAYSEMLLKNKFKIIKPFVAEISEIPLPNKSINITTSSHALEPNGGRLKDLMIELFRVTINKLVLFEPCFEINTDEGKIRMERLGYIKNIDGIVQELGGKIIEKIVIKNISNPINPTVCFVIIPPSNSELSNTHFHNSKIFYSVPGTEIPLEKVKKFYFSEKVGLCYPILNGIPILKSSTAILASSLRD